MSDLATGSGAAAKVELELSLHRVMGPGLLLLFIVGDLSRLHPRRPRSAARLPAAMVRGGSVHGSSGAGPRDLVRSRGEPRRLYRTRLDRLRAGDAARGSLGGWCSLWCWCPWSHAHRLTGQIASSPPAICGRPACLTGSNPHRTRRSEIAGNLGS
jgi:hypothetical protein